MNTDTLEAGTLTVWFSTELSVISDWSMPSSTRSTATERSFGL